MTKLEACKARKAELKRDLRAFTNYGPVVVCAYNRAVYLIRK